MIAAYPFATAAPFQQKIVYDFAKCDAADFLGRWQESRCNALEQLRVGAVAVQDASPVPSIEGATRLDARLVALEDLVLSGMGLTKVAEVSQALQPFLAKFEVAGRLWSHYDADLRRHPKSHELDLRSYLRFGRILGEVAGHHRSTQFLSTFLKLMDVLCCVPADRFCQPWVNEFSLLVDRERVLVERLTAR